MVEYNPSIDTIFGSLADSTRRDILQRVAQAELSIKEIALPYDMSMAAISKHIKILEQAKLVIKRKRGKQHLVCAAPEGLADAKDFLKEYEALWNQRFDALEQLLESDT